MIGPAPALHAVVEGSGTPLLLLHGFTGSTHSMAGIAAGLRERHRVLRLDLIGHGESPAPAAIFAYSMQSCVAQIAAALDAHAIERAHVIGYSMGGRTALALAAWRPERVASAVLVGASAGIADADARAARIRDDDALAERIEREGLEPFVDAWMALPLFASQKRLGETALAAARTQRMHNRVRGLANSLRGMGSGVQPPLHAHLPEIAAPVLLIHGDEDAKFEGIAEQLAASLPQGQRIALPEAGHACHLEAPEMFLACAREFIAGCEARNPMQISA